MSSPPTARRGSRPKLCGWRAASAPSCPSCWLSSLRSARYNKIWPACWGHKGKRCWRGPGCAERCWSGVAMDWSPGPEMNSVAVLLAHITGVLHEGIDIALDDPPTRVRAQEIQTRGVVSAEMLRRLDAVIDYARGALPRLGLEDLSKERTDE